MEQMAASVTRLAAKKAKKRKHKEVEPQQEEIVKKAKKPKKSAKAKKVVGVPSQDPGVSTEIPEQAPPASLPTCVQPPQPSNVGQTPAIGHATWPQGIQVTAPTTRSTTGVERNEVNDMATSIPDVNKQDDRAVWLLNSAAALPSATTRPVCIAELLNDPVRQMQACSIVDNTPSLLFKGTNKVKQYPFEYVRRGDDKRPTAMNSLSLPEHLWGIFAMIHDPATANNIKPALLRHVEEIVEDCRDYEWSTAVRRWSEECFSLVAENRLPQGWLTAGRIQLLRVSISRVSTAKINGQSKDFAGKSFSISLRQLLLTSSGNPAHHAQHLTPLLGALYNRDML